MKFQNVPELMNSMLREEAFNSYLKLAKELRNYEEGILFELWPPVFATNLNLNKHIECKSGNY